MTQEIAMLHDMSRCTACRGCMVACKQWHDLPPDMDTPFEGEYQSHKDLTPRVYTLIEMKERFDDKGKFHWDFFKKNCFHCGDPACAKGCPENAINRNENGTVVIDESKCVGCHYCEHNCPWHIPKIDEIRHKSTKCDLCYDRIAHGYETTGEILKPSCAKTCTAHALEFGTIEEMKQLAAERLAMIQPNHPNANIYCPEGVGGTHMIYVLPDKPEVFGLPANPVTPLSIDLWKAGRTFTKLAIGGAAAGIVGAMVLSKMVKSSAKSAAKEQEKG